MCFKEEKQHEKYHLDEIISGLSAIDFHLVPVFSQSWSFCELVNLPKVCSALAWTSPAQIISAFGPLWPIKTVSRHIQMSNDSNM